MSHEERHPDTSSVLGPWIGSGAGSHISVLIVSLALLVFFLVYSPMALALTEEEKNNIDLYQRLAPGVVNITSTVIEHDFFLNVIPRKGTGSGSIIDSRGYILTNNHVIGDGKLEVTLADGKKYTAKLIGSDPDTDLAVLKIEAPKESLTVIPMGDSTDLKVGQKAMAIGQPLRAGPDPYDRGDQLRRAHNEGGKRHPGRGHHPDGRLHQSGQLRGAAHRFFRQTDRHHHGYFQPDRRKRRDRLRNSGQYGQKDSE